MYGGHGKILHVDLSQGKTHIEYPDENFYRKYLGGQAMGLYYLLNELQGTKCAVLGDMLELGLYEEQGHEMVGVRAAQVVKRLITVGHKAKTIARTARRSGLPDQMITSVDTVEEAINILRGTFTKDDVVLIKGSHGLHMEQIVYALEVDV